MSGLPRVFSRECDTCVFRPGNRMRLEPGRLGDIIRTNLSRGTALICHQTTYEQHPEIGETVCRGWWDRFRHRTRSIILMGRLVRSMGLDGDGFERVDPPRQHAEQPRDTRSV